MADQVPNENVWKRLTRLFRSGPVVRHKIAGGEKVPNPQGTAKAFKKELSSLYVRALSSYANYERLSRYCVTGDTLIPVNLEEGNIRIDELVGRVEAGEDIRVASYDRSRDEVVYAPITKAICNGDREICEVELDDGSVIRCTPDHRFMLRDGSYREARYLTESTALMPFHRKQWGGQRGEYRYTYAFARGWVPEHVLVAESASERRINREDGLHIHHRNFRHTDNSASNLEVMPAAEHLALHARINNARFSDPKEREKQGDIARSRWQEGGDLREAQKAGTLVSERGRQAHSEWISKYNKTNKPGRGNAGREDQKGLDNANADKSLTFQTICDAYRPGMKFPELCVVLKSSRYKVLKRLKWGGFDSFEAFQSDYKNHKVVSVRMTGEVERVYDLTVSPHHNFAISSAAGKSLIFIHNSDYNEMEYTPELHSAIDIYADEATVKNDDGDVIEVTSRNAEIKEILETLFFDVLDVNFNAWSWMRHFVKFGDLCLFVDADEEHGILNLIPIPINEVEREEGFDPKDPLAVRFRWLTRGNTLLQNWQIIHFRLLGNDAYLPYGSSVLEPARRIWRQLILIEDAMLVYRIVRSPERRVFHIEIANTPPDQVDAFIEQVKTQMKRNTIVDSQTGRVDLRYNPLSVEEDYFLPKRGEQKSQIDTLAGGQFTGDIEDVQYIQSKMFAAIKIPRAYLGYEDQLGSKATLAQEDVRFSRTIERIQGLFVAELNKIAIIHLFLCGFSGQDLRNFEIAMANPSTVAEQQRLELWRMKLEVAGMAQEGMFDRGFVHRRIFNLNDRQIAAIKDGKRVDRLEDALLQSIEAPPGPEPPAGAGPEGVPAEAEPAPGSEELPNTLGGPEATAPAPQTAGLARPGPLIRETYNPGSSGNRAELAVDKGKDLFSTGEDALALSFGTKKQTASDPNDRRAARRMITRPFSEDQGVGATGEGQIEEAEEMLEEIGLWLRRWSR